MQVVVTAGHVDHGKSALVLALTGMDPDRWVEERRRGLTIDLGFAWTCLPSGLVLAIVDVPGHERFVPNMLAGVGSVPAALMVVAADSGWMPQSEEHLVALDAFGVRHGILVISRSDLASPNRAMDQARRRLAGTSLAGVPAVAVSALDGTGIDALVTERCFVIRGAGTVVTGTLPAGAISVGDELTVSRTGRAVEVRAIQTLGRNVESAQRCAGWR